MASDCFWEREGQDCVGVRSWRCHHHFPSAAAARNETRNAQEKGEKKMQKIERIEEEGWMKEGSEPAGPFASAPPPSGCC